MVPCAFESPAQRIKVISPRPLLSEKPVLVMSEGIDSMINSPTMSVTSEMGSKKDKNREKRVLSDIDSL